MNRQAKILFANDKQIIANKHLQHLIKGSSKDFCLTLVNDEIIVVIKTIKQNNLTLDRIRMLAGEIARELGSSLIEMATIDLRELVNVFSPFREGEIVTAFVEGWNLGAYRFTKYKTVSVDMATQLELKHSSGLESFIEVGKQRAEATAFARDLVNEPPDILNPVTFLERLVKAFDETQVNISVLDKTQLEAMEMNGVLAVSRGSKYPPSFVELTYCNDSSKPFVALVGKGVTFDTGGISLKVRRDISGMRMDMGGAAAVAGAIKLLAAMRASVNVVGLIPIVENIPDNQSLLPGEIIRYKNGCTVQVGNTDAEGRLILADGLIRANQLGAEYVVDIATLTSSIRAALGTRVAGVFGDEDLANKLKKIGNQNGDFVWPMPLIDEYEEQLKSDYADLCNISSLTEGGGGSIIAGLFLRHFVSDPGKWLHIDMASVNSSAEIGYFAKSASGFGVRLLADYVEYVSDNDQST